MLYLLCCVDTGLNPVDDATKSTADETGDGSVGGIDTGGLEEVDTGGGSIQECPSPDGEAFPVRVVADCQGEPGPIGDLVELWSMEAADESAFDRVGTVRTRDANDDGVIDDLDPMQVLGVARPRYLAHDEGGGCRAVIVDEQGVELGHFREGTYAMGLTAADIHPGSPGIEAAITGYYDPFTGGDPYIEVVSVTGASWPMPSPFDGSGSGSFLPWLTDLEGDGSPELVAAPFVIDVLTGAVLAAMDGVGDTDAARSISADLDRDGVEEILVANWDTGEVTMHAPDGTRLATCLSFSGHFSLPPMAVGNLDADDDGEFVVATGGPVAICDTDGTMLRAVDLGNVEPAMIALAQLDDDIEPEILVEDYFGILALDTDLGLLWTYPADANPMKAWTWYPFSVADLDGNGTHELILPEGGALKIVDATGAVVGGYAEFGGQHSWIDQPVVADIDGDGLAEIVTAGSQLVVLETAAGGWAVEEAEYIWPAMDRHPGDRTLDGGVTGPNAFWLDPERNVWQGLPAGDGGYPELAVTLDVCVESCAGEAVVTVQVSNPSTRQASEEVAVVLESVATGEVLGRGTVNAPLASGTAVELAFRVPSDRLAEGLLASIDGDDLVRECDQQPNEATWLDSPCP